MDLLIVDTYTDFIAVKSGACQSCAEKKLGVKILRAMKLSPEDFLSMKKEYDLRGVSVKCECNEFTPIKYK